MALSTDLEPDRVDERLDGWQLGRGVRIQVHQDHPARVYRSHMEQRADKTGAAPERGPAVDGQTVDGPAVDTVVAEAGRRLRAPWAASAAGLLFAVLFTAALLLLRNQATVTATDAELAVIYARGEDLAVVIGGLYLAPFAGIMFLWFVAVIRDQLGELEDRFFATVFFGSGLVFVALLFAAAAVASAATVGVRYLDQPPPSAETMGLLRAISYTLLFAFATRAAAVFLFATATIGLKSSVFPRWLAVTGYVLGAVLLLVVSFWDWSILVLPAWVAAASLFILRRERQRRG